VQVGRRTSARPAPRRGPVVEHREVARSRSRRGQVERHDRRHAPVDQDRLLVGERENIRVPTRTLTPCVAGNGRPRRECPPGAVLAIVEHTPHARPGRAAAKARSTRWSLSSYIVTSTLCRALSTRAINGVSPGRAREERQPSLRPVVSPAARAGTGVCRAPAQGEGHNDRPAGPSTSADAVGRAWSVLTPERGARGMSGSVAVVGT